MIDYFAGLAAPQQGDPVTTEQATTSYHRLVAMGQKAKADELRSTWGKQHLHTKVDTVETELWKLIAEPSLDLASLPAFTFTLHFTFSLAQPYLSKDDNPFYIIDNPIVRDKVFRLPMVRPSSWKGSLRHALWQAGRTKDDPQIQRLFGDANDNDDSGQAGRLYFYPTFFDKTSLEIINPHNRTTRVGKNPILLEAVPAGATGTFTLLYVPFDCIGEDKDATRAEVAEDLKLVATGVQAMLTLYGFGAKTSSGFGLAKEKLVGDGQLRIRALQITEPTPPTSVAKVEPSLARYLAAPGQLHPDFRTADGSLISEASYQTDVTKQGRQYGKKDQQLYKKAREWWEREGKMMAEREPEPIPIISVSPAPTWPVWAFADFTALVSQTAQVAHQLSQEGAS